MLKGALVGAIALMVGTGMLASAQPRTTTLTAYDATLPSIPRVTEANIARLKSVLNLTPEQIQHWTPGEAALRALAREQRDNDPQAAGDMNARTLAAAGVIGRIRQLSATAAPLIRSLDPTQRREAMSLVKRLGYESLVASF